MNQAIIALQIARDTAANNAPIHDAAGDHAQAQLDRDVVADCDQAITVLQSQNPVLDAIGVLASKVDALASKPQGSGVPPAPLLSYVDGLRDPDNYGFAYSQLLDEALAKNPKLGIGPRVCVRTVTDAFPNVHPPAIAGCSLVKYNCDNAGFKNHNTYTFDGHLVGGVVSLFGRTRSEWESEIQTLIVARAQDAAPGNTGDQFTPH